jgi:hypothetical protein
LENWHRHLVDGITKCLTRFFLTKFGNRAICKERKSSFNKMTMLALHTSILLMSMWKSDTMNNSIFMKELMEITIFPSLVCLNTFYFGIDETFNHGLEM